MPDSVREATEAAQGSPWPDEDDGPCPCVRHHVDLLDSGGAEGGEDSSDHVALFGDWKDGRLCYEPPNVPAGSGVGEYADG